MQTAPLDATRQLVGLLRDHLGDLVRRKPKLLPKLAINYARMNLLGEDVLRTASISIESGCNATCGHCSADFMMSQTEQKKDRLTLDQYRDAIDGFLKAGAVSINLTGGEPLLNPDIYDIIGMVPSHRGVVNIQTNGLNLTDRVARKLKDAGCYIVMISLHSHRPEEHDELLEIPGAYDKVMRAIANCHTYGLPVILNCTITHQKVQDGTLWKMVHLAEDKKVTVNFVQPCTSGKWEHQLDVRLTDEDYVEFDKAMALPWVVWEGKSNYKVNGCRPGIERMYMSTSGDIIPCAFIHLNFGNVKNEPVAGIWGRLRGFERFRNAPKRCMASDDESFYEDYVQRIADHDEALLPIELHPTYQEEHPEEAASIRR